MEYERHRWSKMPHTYKYPRPSLTVDCVVFGIDPTDEHPLKVLLIKRGLEAKNGDPAERAFIGSWALPGGYVKVADEGGQGEGLEEAARRELFEEAGIKVDYLEQLYTFGEPGRDPRGRVVSVAYYALVSSGDHEAKAGSDAVGAYWFSIHGVQKGLCLGLVFDHLKILETALSRLQVKVRYAPVGFNLLPPKFTIPQLQRVYEAILMRKLEKRNFRKRILKMEVLVARGMESGSGRTGPKAALYSFDKRAYDKAVRDGFNFEI